MLLLSETPVMMGRFSPIKSLVTSLLTDNPDAMDVIIRTGGLQSLVAELQETASGAENRTVSQ
jgi:hypothetical protein